MSYITYTQVNSMDEFAIIAGGYFVITFNAYDDDGIAPLNISGASIKFTMSPYGQSDFQILQKNGLITSAVNGTFTVTLQDADTGTLSGKYLYQLVITAFGGKVYRPVQGVILIIPKIPVG